MDTEMGACTRLRVDDKILKFAGPNLMCIGTVDHSKHLIEIRLD